MAPPGILRVTGQPGSSQKSVTRILSWSLVAQSGITQTLCIRGLRNLRAGDTGEAVTVGGGGGGETGPGASEGSPRGLRRDKFQEPRVLRNQEGSGVWPWPSRENAWLWISRFTLLGLGPPRKIVPEAQLSQWRWHTRAAARTRVTGTRTPPSPVLLFSFPRASAHDNLVSAERSAAKLTPQTEHGGSLDCRGPFLNDVGFKVRTPTAQSERRLGAAH